VTLLLGPSRTERADAQSGHVGFPSISTEVCVAAQFRNLQTPEVVGLHSMMFVGAAEQRSCSGPDHFWPHGKTAVSALIV